MAISVIRADDQFTHVALSGWLDAPAVDEIETDFLAHTAERERPAIVDLSGVDFMGSMGMRMLVKAAKSLVSCGRRLVLLGPQDPVEEGLRTAGLDSVLPIASDADEAQRLLHTCEEPAS